MAVGKGVVEIAQFVDGGLELLVGRAHLLLDGLVELGGLLEQRLRARGDALGAILGDTSLFWIARKSSAKMQPHLDKALENPKVRTAW